MGFQVLCQLANFLGENRYLNFAGPGIIRMGAKFLNEAILDFLIKHTHRA